MALAARQLLTSRLLGGGTAGGYSYVDGIPCQVANATLAAVGPVTSMYRQRANGNTLGAYVDVADSRGEVYLVADRRAIATSHATHATAIDTGGEAVNAVASCRTAPCKRLASYQSLSV